MKLTSTIVALAVVTLAASTSSAQHFDRQRKEAIARQAATQHHFSHQRGVSAHHGASYHGASHRGGAGHWGGPTTQNRFYFPSHGHGSHHNNHFYSVGPFGYGVPGYGYYGGFPSYAAPYCGSGIYIHREIYLGR